jgi:hypothetical protein
MDIRSWGVSQIVALTVVYWGALVLLTRFRHRRRVSHVLSGVDTTTLEPGVLTEVSPEVAVRRMDSEQFELRLAFRGGLNFGGMLLVLGPPVALFLLRYVILS